MSDTVRTQVPNLPRRASRIGGIDVARGMAIIGMLLVHIGPTGQDGFLGRLYALPHGRAVVLFVMLAGLGVSMLFASNRSSAALARLKVTWTLLVLLVIGLLLQTLGTAFWVILHYYATLFLFALPLAYLPNFGLLVVALLSALLGPLAYLAGRIYWPTWFDESSVAWGDGIIEIAHGLALSGKYPSITYLAPFAIGMWLGRLDLRVRKTWVNLILGGGTVAVAAVALAATLQAAAGVPTDDIGWDRLMITKPHSQMPLWMIGSIGSAVCTLGLSLWVANVLGRWGWPLVAFGQLALSVYVGQAFLLFWARPAITSNEIGVAAGTVLALVTGAAVFAMLWLRFFSRGPLELLINIPWRVLERVQRRRR